MRELAFYSQFAEVDSDAHVHKTMFFFKGLWVVNYFYWENSPITEEAQ